MSAFVFTIINVNLAYAAFSFRRPSFSQCYLNNDTKLIYFPLATNVTKVSDIKFFLQEINVKEPLTTISCNDETTTTNLLNCSVNKDILLGRYNIKRVEANATINQSLIDFPLLSFKDTINYTTPTASVEIPAINLSSDNSSIDITVLATNEAGVEVSVPDNTNALFLLNSTNAKYHFRGVVTNKIAKFNVNSSNIIPGKYSAYYFDGCQNYINANHTVNINFKEPTIDPTFVPDDSKYDFVVEFTAIVNRCNGVLLRDKNESLENIFTCTRDIANTIVVKANCVITNKDNGEYTFKNMSCDGVVIASFPTQLVRTITGRVVNMSKQATFQKIALTTMFSEPLSIALNPEITSLPQIIANNSTDIVLNNCSIVDNTAKTLNCTITDKDLSMSNQPYRIYTLTGTTKEDTGISLLFNIKKNYSNIIDPNKAQCLSYTIIQVMIFIIVLI